MENTHSHPDKELMHSYSSIANTKHAYSKRIPLQWASQMTTGYKCTENVSHSSSEIPPHTHYGSYRPDKQGNKRLWGNRAFELWQQEYKTAQMPWKPMWKLLRKLKVELPGDPSHPLLCIHPKELALGSHNICLPLFIAAVATKAKICIQGSFLPLWQTDKKQLRRERLYSTYNPS